MMLGVTAQQRPSAAVQASSPELELHLEGPLLSLKAKLDSLILLLF